MSQIIIKIFESMNKYVISPDSALTVYFAVLGIMVTLISISSVLTKEIRQDLIIKRYIKNGKSISFLIFLITSFLTIIMFNLLDFPIKGITTLLLFIILFIWTVYYIIQFITSLSRRWFYHQLFGSLKNSLKKSSKKTKDKQAYSKTQFEEFDDFTKNLSYIQNNSQDFIEETSFLKKVMLNCIDTKNEYVLQDFFNDGDLLRIDNEQYFENLIRMFYELRFLKKEVPSPHLMVKYQAFMYRVIEYAFISTNQFSPRLNTAGLYIKEFLDIRYVDTFKNIETKETWIKHYQTLVSQTIDSLFRLNKVIMEAEMPDTVKKRYFQTQLSNLNKSLEYFSHLHQTDFDKNYYNSTTEINKDEIDSRMAFINNQQSKLDSKLSELFYLILYKIDIGQFKQDYFNVVMKLYKTEALQRNFLKYEEFGKLNWLNYDDFEGGAQAIASFNFNKYRLIIIFYDYIQSDGELAVFSRFQKEIFSERVSLLSELKKLSYEDILKFYSAFDKSKLTEFKKLAKKEIDKRIKNIDLEEVTYLRNTPLVEKYVTDFISDCKKEWSNNQEELSKFLEVKEYKGGSKIKNYFGQFKLFERRWFLESFDKTVGLSRDNASLFMSGQINSKNKQIIEKIESLADKSIIVKDLLADIDKFIKPNKDYFLFYKFSDLKLYDIPGIEWTRESIINAKLKYKKSTIYFCNVHNDENILFEQDSLKLKQYSQGYEKINEPFVVLVNDLTDDNVTEIKKSKENDFKDESLIRTYLQVRLAEKFELIKNNKKGVDNTIIKLRF
jgi:hypothetical protein